MASAFRELRGEAQAQLTTVPTLGPWFCHHALDPPSQSPFPTITCLCPLESGAKHS